MLRRKSIALQKELLGVLSPEEEKQFIFGCIFYEEYTKEGRHAISKRKAATLSDDVIKLILKAIMLSNLDLEKDKEAFLTCDRLSDELAVRYPIPKEEVKESLRRFKENHKEFFEMDNDKLGYFVFMDETESQTCDNCKYLDDCDAEYQQEQPNYCENWERR